MNICRRRAVWVTRWGTAQIRLRPGTAITHPSGGVAGSRDVDAGHRLWFCRGGGKWVQFG